MRLIGSFTLEKKALYCQLILEKEGIATVCEPQKDGDQSLFTLWVLDENQWQQGQELYHQFQKNPILPPPLAENQTSTPTFPTQSRFRKYPITFVIILLSVLVYVYSKTQSKIDSSIPDSSVESTLLFDEPLPADQTGSQWQGISCVILHRYQVSQDTSSCGSWIPHSIAQGQYWRLISPAFLHSSLFHLLLNLLIALALLRQVEERLSCLKMLLLTFLLAIISNTFQYIVSGPYFVGLSGIICGLIGFIRARQKKAPWEGYPMSSTFFSALMMYITITAAFDMGLFLFSLFSHILKTTAIASTAHLSGTLFGFLLGRVPLFRRKRV